MAELTIDFAEYLKKPTDLDTALALSNFARAYTNVHGTLLIVESHWTLDYTYYSLHQIFANTNEFESTTDRTLTFPKLDERLRNYRVSWRELRWSPIETIKTVLMLNK